MKILVTGAKGFAGRNLVENLKNIRDGKIVQEIFRLKKSLNMILIQVRNYLVNTVRKQILYSILQE